MSQNLHLEAARTRVSIAPEWGGRIAQIKALHHGAWLSLLHEPVEIPVQQRDAMEWGSFVMAPWPNRIAHARFPWKDTTIELPSNFGAHAIHGLCFDSRWEVEAVAPAACSLRMAFDARFPFGGYARQRIEVLDDGLAQTVEVHADKMPFPAGVGWHPWFRRDIGGAEHVHAQVDAPTRYELRDGIPTGRLLLVEREHDLRDYPALSEGRLDDCYLCPTGALRLRWDDVELWIESSDNVRHAVVYTPAHAVCLEPQTCAIDAFNLAAQGHDGTGMAIVEPGSPLVATTTWRWASAEPQWQQIHPAATDA